MGTKEKPDEFDCYDAALPDEPMFVLLARDTHAPESILKWADERELEIHRGYTPKSDLRKVEQARDVAADMVNWRRQNMGVWKGAVRNNTEEVVSTYPDTTVTLEKLNEFIAPAPVSTAPPAEPLPELSPEPMSVTEALAGVGIYDRQFTREKIAETFENAPTLEHEFSAQVTAVIPLEEETDAEKDIRIGKEKYSPPLETKEAEKEAEPTIEDVLARITAEGAEKNQ